MTDERTRHMPSLPTLIERWAEMAESESGLYVPVSELQPLLQALRQNAARGFSGQFNGMDFQRHADQLELIMSKGVPK